MLLFLINVKDLNHSNVFIDENLYKTMLIYNVTH